MNECKHVKTLRIPDFPDDVLVCRDCGQAMPLVGYAGGIRDYYQPGDPSWRRFSAVQKAKWIMQDVWEDLVQCPACCFVGTIDDFDCLGADSGNLFCNQCGAEFDSCPDDNRQRLLF